LYRKNILKIFFLRSNGQEMLIFTRKHSDVVQKSWPLEVWWGHNRGNCFCMCLYRENILKIFSKTTGPEKLEFT
jgi:hypothetical protein